MAIVKTLPCIVYDGWPFGSISLRKIREAAMAEIRHLIPIEKVYAARTTQAGLRAWWTAGSVAEDKVDGKTELGCETRAMQPARCTAPSPGPMKVEGRHAMAPVTFRRPGLGSLGIRLAAAAALILQLGAIGAHAEELKVTIDNFTFTPAELKAKVGDTVTWTNHDDIPHTVVSAGKFRSKAMDTDNTFSFTFTAAGDYPYFCSIHPHMTGMIKVE